MCKVFHTSAASQHVQVSLFIYRAVKKVQPVLGGFSRDTYKTDRLWATASDGTKVPMSIVYKQGLVKLDGSDPLLLNGSDCILLCFYSS